MAKIRLLLVDDHAIVRKGLREILADSPDLVVAAECSNGQGLLGLIEHEKFDLVLLDITMPGRSGLEVLREIKKSRPKLPVLVLSMHPEDQFAVRLLKCGAAGYVTKESAPEELIASYCFFV